jgi:prevent-host-death family protein
MKQVSVRDIRSKLTHLEEMLAVEGEIVITRRGEPIARILPVALHRGIPSRAASRARLPKQKVPSEVYLREERDER